MEIYFDKKTIRILRYIRWHKNSTVDEIQRKFGESADTFLLINLCLSDYIVAVKKDGTYTNYQNKTERVIDGSERFWVSPKGRKLLDDRFDRLWQWSVPVTISTIALIISYITLLTRL